ncbi:TPA: hypothetical protein P8O34_005831 [Pseudomonas aeruginosa]|nr:hypothetical protein [Pseudomonas aeruginosa]
MAFGSNSNVYMANSTSKSIYVIAAPNPAWAATDFTVDLALMAAGLGEIKAAVTTATLPAELKTIKDIWSLVSISGKLLSGTVSAGTRSAEAAQKVIQEIYKVGIAIPSNEYKDVFEQSAVEIFLSASGYAGMLGASTVSLFVYAEDTNRTASFNSDPDYSWIAKNDGIWRAEYGSVWKQQGNAPETQWS